MTDIVEDIENRHDSSPVQTGDGFDKGTPTEASPETPSSPLTSPGSAEAKSRLSSSSASPDVIPARPNNRASTLSSSGSQKPPPSPVEVPLKPPRQSDGDRNSKSGHNPEGGTGTPKSSSVRVKKSLSFKDANEREIKEEQGNKEEEEDSEEIIIRDRKRDSNAGEDKNYRASFMTKAKGKLFYKKKGTFSKWKVHFIVLDDSKMQMNFFKSQEDYENLARCKLAIDLRFVTEIKSQKPRLLQSNFPFKMQRRAGLSTVKLAAYNEDERAKWITAIEAIMKKMSMSSELHSIMEEKRCSTLPNRTNPHSGTSSDSETLTTSSAPDQDELIKPRRVSSTSGFKLSSHQISSVKLKSISSEKKDVDTVKEKKEEDDEVFNPEEKFGVNLRRVQTDKCPSRSSREQSPEVIEFKQKFNSLSLSRQNKKSPKLPLNENLTCRHLVDNISKEELNVTDSAQPKRKSSEKDRKRSPSPNIPISKAVEAVIKNQKSEENAKIPEDDKTLKLNVCHATSTTITYEDEEPGVMNVHETILDMNQEIQSEKPDIVSSSTVTEQIKDPEEFRCSSISNKPDILEPSQTIPEIRLNETEDNLDLHSHMVLKQTLENPVGSNNTGPSDYRLLETNKKILSNVDYKTESISENQTSDFIIRGDQPEQSDTETNCINDPTTDYRVEEVKTDDTAPKDGNEQIINSVTTTSESIQNSVDNDSSTGPNLNLQEVKEQISICENNVHTNLSNPEMTNQSQQIFTSTFEDQLKYSEVTSSQEETSITESVTFSSKVNISMSETHETKLGLNGCTDILIAPTMEFQSETCSEKFNIEIATDIQDNTNHNSLAMESKLLDDACDSIMQTDAKEEQNDSHQKLELTVENDVSNLECKINESAESTNTNCSEVSTINDDHEFIPTSKSKTTKQLEIATNQTSPEPNEIEIHLDESSCHSGESEGNLSIIVKADDSTDKEKILETEKNEVSNVSVKDTQNPTTSSHLKQDIEERVYIEKYKVKEIEIKHSSDSDVSHTTGNEEKMKNESFINSDESSFKTYNSSMGLKSPKVENESSTAQNILPAHDLVEDHGNDLDPVSSLKETVKTNDEKITSSEVSEKFQENIKTENSSAEELTEHKECESKSVDCNEPEQFMIPNVSVVKSSTELEQLREETGKPIQGVELEETQDYFPAYGAVEYRIKDDKLLTLEEAEVRTSGITGLKDFLQENKNDLSDHDVKSGISRLGHSPAIERLRREVP